VLAWLKLFATESHPDKATQHLRLPLSNLHQKLLTIRVVGSHLQLIETSQMLFTDAKLLC
jgi:hypothetical protein